MNSKEVVDPVCKMPLRSDQIKESALVDGVPYFFCSIGCRAEFQRHPEDYLRRSAEESERSHV